MMIQPNENLQSFGLGSFTGTDGYIKEESLLKLIDLRDIAEN
jgi:hypothetical protein